VNFHPAKINRGIAQSSEIKYKLNEIQLSCWFYVAERSQSVSQSASWSRNEWLADCSFSLFLRFRWPGSESHLGFLANSNTKYLREIHEIRK